jgi:hypothetical protein
MRREARQSPSACEVVGWSCACANGGSEDCTGERLRGTLSVAAPDGGIRDEQLIELVVSKGAACDARDVISGFLV